MVRLSNTARENRLMMRWLPRPLRRAFNLLRRFPSLSFLFGALPVEQGVERFYSEWIGNEDVVVEVGARMGDGTRVLARLAKHVYAFEPARESFVLLRAFTGKRKNVEAYNLALGDHIGEAYLEKDRGFSGVASLKRLANVNYRAKEKVKMARLDGVKFRLRPTSLVLDCEGSEVEVLRGAEMLLPNLASVLVETHTMGDGSTTTDEVVLKLKRFFPNLRMEYADSQRWVLARKEKDV